ncbi:MAG: aldo/keto reductase [Synechococcus sp. YX04-3]|nr:MAG: aldo/keto reductase [Synechococcus sp. YX04-3]
MEAIMTGRGGDALNGIGFGTWAWGNQLLWGYDAERDDRLLEETFRQALASGLGLIDTADSYGTGRLNGRSEKLLGRFAARLPATRRADLCIATKLAPFPWRLGRRGLDQALQASRQRLQGHLRRVQLHWSTARYAPWQEVQLLDGLADRVLDGSISEIGVSNIGPKRLAWMQQRLAERGVPLRSVQVQYSLLSPGDAKVDALRQLCRERGIEVLAYSPLAFGVLTLPPDGERRPRTVLQRQLLARLQPASRSLRAVMAVIAGKRSVSMAQVALNWCRAQGTTPIPGLRTPEQARDVAGALQWSLTSAELDQLSMARQQCTVRTLSNPFQSA